MKARSIPWIQLCYSLPRHPKFLRARAALGVEEDFLLIYLIHWWWYAAEFAPDGRLASRPTRGDTVPGAENPIEGGCNKLLQGVQQYVAPLRGCSQTPGACLQVLIDVGFIDYRVGGGYEALYLHAWQEYAGRVLSVRERTNARVTRYRRGCNMDVTPVLRSSTVLKGEGEREGEDTPPTPPGASPGRPTQGGEPAPVGVGGEQAGKGISEASGSAVEGMQGSEAEVERQLVQKALKVLVGVPATIRQYVGRWIVRVGAMRVEEMLASSEARKATPLEIDRRLCPLPAAVPLQQRVRTAEDMMREQGFSEEEIARQREEAAEAEEQRQHEERKRGGVAPAMRDLLGGGVLKRADAGAPANGVSTSDLQREALAALQRERERVCESEPVCESEEEDV